MKHKFFKYAAFFVIIWLAVEIVRVIQAQRKLNNLESELQQLLKTNTEEHMNTSLISNSVTNKNEPKTTTNRNSN